jgi:amidase
VTQIHDLTATEQARLIRERALSPVEVVDHYLERIDRHSAAVGAFVTVTGEIARSGAADLERRLADKGAQMAPYAGVPIGIKDLTLTAGVTTTFGSAALADHVPSVDAAIVSRIRHAGFLLAGKTSTPEFGPTCYTEPAVAPPARTPWDPSRSASGSSGGAAAAVAAGLLPIAHGSDGGGSVRTPAANCGLVGFKPSRARISPAPAVDIIGTSTDGVLARTVEDAAGFLHVVCGPEPGDRFTVADGGDSIGDALHAHPARLRIARCVDPGNGAPVHSEVVAAVDRAAEALCRMGHVVEDIEHPMGGAYAAIQDDITGLFAVGVSAAVTTLVPAERRHLLRPFSQWLVERASRTAAPELLLSLQRLFAAAATALQTLEPFDALLTPTTTQPAAAVGAFRDDENPGNEPAAMLAWTAYTPPYNLTGQPAVSLPLAATAEGIPLGVHLVGRRGGDAALLSLAAQLEEAIPWRGRHAPIWNQ